jgi:hypothetical protein
LLLTELFNGKPQASLIDFASAFGLPLNDIAQHAAKRAPRERRRIGATQKEIG